MEQANIEQAWSQQDARQRERLLRVLSAITFLIFIQAYMVAPLIPRLAAASCGVRFRLLLSVRR